jgi:hypothetical protein
MGVKFNSKAKIMAMILVEPGLELWLLNATRVAKESCKTEYFAEAGNFLPTTANKKSTFAQVILFIWRQLK